MFWRSAVFLMMIFAVHAAHAQSIEDGKNLVRDYVTEAKLGIEKNHLLEIRLSGSSGENSAVAYSSQGAIVQFTHGDTMYDKADIDVEVYELESMGLTMDEAILYLPCSAVKPWWCEQWMFPDGWFYRSRTGEFSRNTDRVPALGRYRPLDLPFMQAENWSDQPAADLIEPFLTEATSVSEVKSQKDGTVAVNLKRSSPFAGADGNMPYDCMTFKSDRLVRFQAGVDSVIVGKFEVIDTKVEWGRKNEYDLPVRLISKFRPSPSRETVLDVRLQWFFEDDAEYQKMVSVLDEGKEAFAKYRNGQKRVIAGAEKPRDATEAKKK